MDIEFSETTSIKQYEKEIEAAMDKQVKHFEKELLKFKTGRAHPAMVEDIKVAVYGTYMPVKELGSISVPEPTLIVIQPWDISIINDIEKAIGTSDLGVTPQNDGEVIRIKIPPMSTSRREELVKSLHQKLETFRVSIRNVRKEILNKIRESEKKKQISEDFSKRLQDLLQKTTDKFIKLGEQLSAKKEGEIKNI